ncbi:disease resistance protein RGA2-like [Telopea speciosissima]|uniref:disease resistance protein RGA2-like n=1 Tax=Telopea speciosissima TaxID=54955 RepID=UPI001CC6EBE6|nr:disease resistance protein RGA2-like [Telopea speciosissima]
MAEAILTDLATKILEGLGSLLIQEIGLASGVKKELSKLKDSLSTINAILLDAETKGSMSHAVRDWLRKLKEVAYDAEDVLDEFATEILRQKVEFRNNNMVVKQDDEVAKFQFKTQSVGMNMDDDNTRRHTDSFVIESEVLGRDKDREKLVKLLLTSSSSGGGSSNNDGEVNNNVMVIPIIGIGGLGKTTLAQCVYNDERVKTHFELRMWECVSFDFKTLTNKAGSEFRVKLSGKRYLLVLDDVWNEHPGEWENLRKFLIGGASGSMILVTTRSQVVASIMQPYKNHHYILEGLNENDCESLFNKRAFGIRNEEINHPELVGIGKEIVRKCGGMPLAAKTLGSLLCHTRNKKDWWDVLDTEIWKLDDEHQEILPALRISYNHLPSHLKQCFAYCSMFPQDHLIDVPDLIHQWMAHGFIKPSPPPTRSGSGSGSGSSSTQLARRSLEDIGNRYFRELLWRSFFQEVEEDDFGNIESCKMHDLVHNLARWVAGTEYYSSSSSSSSSSNINSDQPGVRRHMVFNVEEEGDTLNPRNLLMMLSDKPQKLRTLYLEGHDELGIRTGFIVSPLRGLRVLDLSELGIKHVSSCIGYQLQQLRSGPDHQI